MNPDRKRVGFIGVGGIGRPMAVRLVKTGHDVLACDVSNSALAVFSGLGASTTKRPTDCAFCEVVIVMVANDAQVKAVITGPGGLLEAIDAAHSPMVLIMSSVLPQTIKDVASAAVQKGVRVLDAPVSGGSVSAAEGALTIMVGGAESDLDDARSVLQVLGRNIVHCGALGSGEATKIVNNILGVTNTLLMAEATKLAVELGLDARWLFGVIETSSGRNFATRSYEVHQSFCRLITRDEQSFKALMDICGKDLELASTLAKEAGIQMSILQGIRKAHQEISCGSSLSAWRSLIDQ